MQVHERQEDVERVQQGIQTGRRVSCRRCGVLRPRQTHHAGARADRYERGAEQNYGKHPGHCAQRLMPVAHCYFQKLAPCASYRTGAAVDRVVARDEHPRGGTDVADAAVVLRQLVIRLRVRGGGAQA